VLYACKKVFTPHLGELRTLSEGMQNELQQNELKEAPNTKQDMKEGIYVFKTADAVARHYNAVVLAKNSVSYIASPHGNIPYVLDGRTPFLATGGSGDVLAGFLGSQLAHAMAYLKQKNIQPEDSSSIWDVLHKSTAYATLVHLEVGKYLERTQGSADATDIVRAIPSVHSLV